MSKKVEIVEVGPRDGLQNERATLSRSVRVEFVQKLAGAGIRRIEAGGFVSADKIPQMADSKTLLSDLIQKLPKARLSALVPNERGMKDALECKVKEVAIFTAASETFCQKNINCSIEESFERFAPVLALAKKNKVLVRGYISMCFGCPYEGEVSEKKVIELAKRLIRIGCYEISIGDTIGVATPRQVRLLLGKLKKAIPLKKIALHFHDTRGAALANIATSIDMGVRVFDSSLGGLGGCPYAVGATGNVATEDAVYLLHGMGFQTGLDLDKLIGINRWMAGQIGRSLPSRVAAAGAIPNYIVGR